MKLLIAVISCHARPDFSDLIRKTWAPLVKGADLKFFIGRGPHEPLEDEVVLDCDDGYMGLPDKVRAIMRWSLEHGYDYTLKCDDDVVIIPDAMLTSDFTMHDFTGCADPAVKDGEILTPWGFCYWLSRRAMELVASSALPGEPGSTHSYVHNNDEAWVSTVLYVNHILLHGDERYYLHRGSLPVVNPVTVPGRRSLRPNRLNKSYTEKPLPNGAFAFCVYLNWKGWHATPDEELHEEFRNIFIRETKTKQHTP